MTATSASRIIQRQLSITPDLAGSRLDQALARLLPELSRSRLREWIESGAVRVDESLKRPRDKVWGGEAVQIRAELSLSDTCVAQPLALRLIHEDTALLVVDKPAGMVVHPAAGNPDGTLQNALLHHHPPLAALPRAGIVHRLDKDTSGLLVVAKTLEARTALVAQLQARRVHREYRALVVGDLPAGGRVEAPIGRHPTQRTKMAVVASGRPAVTHYRVLERYPGHSLLGVELETGRTHQIRVHLSYLRHPLVGDPVYGGRARPPRGVPAALATALQGFRRQALHALRLGLQHPETGASCLWECPLPDDLSALLALLRRATADAPADP